MGWMRLGCNERKEQEIMASLQRHRGRASETSLVGGRLVELLLLLGGSMREFRVFDWSTNALEDNPLLVECDTVTPFDSEFVLYENRHMGGLILASQKCLPDTA